MLEIPQHSPIAANLNFGSAVNLYQSTQAPVSACSCAHDRMGSHSAMILMEHSNPSLVKKISNLQEHTAVSSVKEASAASWPSQSCRVCLATECCWGS